MLKNTKGLEQYYKKKTALALNKVNSTIKIKNDDNN